MALWLTLVIALTCFGGLASPGPVPPSFTALRELIEELANITKVSAPSQGPSSEGAGWLTLGILVQVSVSKAGPGAKMPVGQEEAPWPRGRSQGRERNQTGGAAIWKDGPLKGFGRATASTHSAIPEQRKAKGQHVLRTIWHLSMGFERSSHGALSTAS